MAIINSGLMEFSNDQKVRVDLDAETGEVVKAVTMDADDNETPIGGGGPTVEALNVTENGTYAEEGKAYSPVTVNVKSGYKAVGVDIDATDLQPSTEDPFPIPLAVVDSVGGINIGEQMTGATKHVSAVLANYAINPDNYGQTVHINQFMYTVQVVSGDATYIGGILNISGPCSIKFKLPT